MRARNIKPGIFKNEVLGVEEPILTIIFMGLWCAADRNGVMEDRPLRLKAEIIPYRNDIDFNGYLTVLSRLGFIRRYEVSKKGYIQVINFKKHQRPHHTEKETGMPEYNEKSDSCDLTVKSPLNHRKNPPDSLIPDSLIPDSLIQPQKESEKKFSDDIVQFCDSAFEYLKKEHGKSFPKKVKISDWYDCIDKLIRLDGFTLDEIRDALNWGVRDDFWKTNIVSFSGLRAKKNGDLTKFQKLFNAKKQKLNKNISYDRSAQNAKACQDFINGD